MTEELPDLGPSLRPVVDSLHSAVEATQICIGNIQRLIDFTYGPSREMLYALDLETALLHRAYQELRLVQSYPTECTGWVDELRTKASDALTGFSRCCEAVNKLRSNTVDPQANAGQLRIARQLVKRAADDIKSLQEHLALHLQKKAAKDEGGQSITQPAPFDVPPEPVGQPDNPAHRLPPTKTIQAALLSAFPMRNDLRQMMEHQLGRNLDEIAEGNNLTDVVFALIRRARAEGWLADLITNAHEANPGNPLLRQLAEQLRT